MRGFKKIAFSALAALSIFVAIFIATGIAIKHSAVHSEMRVSLTSNQDQKAFFRADNGSQKAQKEDYLITDLFSTLTLEFKFDYPTPLQIQVENPSSKLVIHHLGIKTKKFYSDWNATEFLNTFDVSGAKYAVENNRLIFKDFGADGIVEFTLKNPEKYLQNIKNYHQNIQASVAFFGLILCFLLFFGFRVNRRQTVKSFAISIWPAIFGLLIYLNYHSPAAPSRITAKINTPKGVVQSTQYLSIRELQNVFIEIPEKIDRFSEVDFTLEHGLFSMHFSPQKVEDQFRYLNKIYVHADAFLSFGKSNQIQLSNSATATKLKLASLLFQAAPFLFFILIFLINFWACQWLLTKHKIALPKLALNALFLNFIALPFVGYLMAQPIYVVSEEKRNAPPLPELNLATVDSFPQQFNAYYQDQFAGRDFFISNYLKIDQALFMGGSLGNQAVLYGKDGWWYFNDEDAPEYYENKSPLTVKELEDIALNINERYTWLKNRGIDYYLVITPYKYNIYPEYLPDNIYKHHEPSKIDAIIAYLRKHSPVKIIDIQPVLREAKKKDVIYYKKDTHWNLLGGYYAYEAIMDSVVADHPELKPPRRISEYKRIPTEQRGGDLTALVGKQHLFPRIEDLLFPKEPYKYKDAPATDYPVMGPEMVTIFKEIPGSTLPKLFMHRDSYSNFLIPYMSDHFGASTYYWSPEFHEEVIEQENPDIVITQILERFIYNLAQPNSTRVKTEYKRTTDTLK